MLWGWHLMRSPIVGVMGFVALALAQAGPQFQKEKLFVMTQFPPEMTNPKSIPASHPDSSYVDGREMVMGVSIEGESRAYPLRIMAYHRIVNDVIGKQAIVLAH
jgi:hypothetical protein